METAAANVDPARLFEIWRQRRDEIVAEDGKDLWRQSLAEGLRLAYENLVGRASCGVPTEISATAMTAIVALMKTRYAQLTQAQTAVEYHSLIAPVESWITGVFKSFPSLEAIEKHFRFLNNEPGGEEFDAKLNPTSGARPISAQLRDFEDVAQAYALVDAWRRHADQLWGRLADWIALRQYAVAAVGATKHVLAELELPADDPENGNLEIWRELMKKYAAAHVYAVKRPATPSDYFEALRRALAPFHAALENGAGPRRLVSILDRIDSEAPLARDAGDHAEFAEFFTGANSLLESDPRPVNALEIAGIDPLVGRIAKNLLHWGNDVERAHHLYGPQHRFFSFFDWGNLHTAFLSLRQQGLQREHRRSLLARHDVAAHGDISVDESVVLYSLEAWSILNRYKIALASSALSQNDYRARYARTQLGIARIIVDSESPVQFVSRLSTFLEPMTAVLEPLPRNKLH